MDNPLNTRSLHKAAQKWAALSFIAARIATFKKLAPETYGEV